MLDEFTQFKILAIKAGGKEELINFMSATCDCPKEEYTDKIVYQILTDLIREIMFEGSKQECIKFYNSIVEFDVPWNRENDYFGSMINRMIHAINMCRIRKDCHCINGFTEEAIKAYNKNYPDDNLKELPKQQ